MDLKYYIVACVHISIIYFQDLTKWKNRRRSTKSDLRRKSQDREHVINQMVNGSLTSFEKKEAGGLLKRYASAVNGMLLVSNNLFIAFLYEKAADLAWLQCATMNSFNMTRIIPPIFSANSLREYRSPCGNELAPRPCSASPPSKSLCSDQEPRTRALLTRSYATEEPVSPHKSTDSQVS